MSALGRRGCRSGGGGAEDRRAVDLPRALVEGVDHPAHRLVEHHADGGLQNAAAELEIDEERDFACRCRAAEEIPLIVQIAERARSRSARGPGGAGRG